MAKWKKLSEPSGEKVWVNLETVAYFQRINNETGIVFIGGRSDNGKVLALSVRETPSDIFEI